MGNHICRPFNEIQSNFVNWRMGRRHPSTITPNWDLIGVLLRIACIATRQSDSRTTSGQFIFSIQLKASLMTIASAVSGLTRPWWVTTRAWIRWPSEFLATIPKTYLLTIFKNGCVNRYLNCVQLWLDQVDAPSPSTPGWTRAFVDLPLANVHCVRYCFAAATTLFTIEDFWFQTKSFLALHNA